MRRYTFQTISLVMAWRMLKRGMPKARVLRVSYNPNRFGDAWTFTLAA